MNFKEIKIELFSLSEKGVFGISKIKSWEYLAYLRKMIMTSI